MSTESSSQVQPANLISQLLIRIKKEKRLAAKEFLAWKNAIVSFLPSTPSTPKLFTRSITKTSSMTSRLVLLLACLLSFAGTAKLNAQAGTTWISRTAEGRPWYSVAYGNGKFVAVAPTPTGNNVMTSPDGITWTSGTSISTTNWFSITFGGGLFVAVGYSNGQGGVMTSPDGVTWTSRTPATTKYWNSVTYGNGKFVAVSTTSSAQPAGVMTSVDGITWTSATAAADNAWSSVTYGNGLFVAVAFSGTGNRVMSSPDGITWTSRTSTADNNWNAVTYGNGKFVAVAGTGTGDRVMTSADGISWTSHAAAINNTWRSVSYGNGLFVAVAGSGSGTGNRVMTSSDGDTWTSRTSASDNQWNSITYANGIFVAVASPGTGNGVMTSSPYNALHFDGNDDYIDLGSSPTLKPKSALTVSVQVKVTDWNALPSNKAVIGNTQAAGYEIYFAAGNKIQGFVRRNGSYAIVECSSLGLAPGWHELTVTFDGRITTLFLDGISKATDNAGANFLYPIDYNTSNSTIIGGEAGASSTPEQGQYVEADIDEVRIWSRALCQQEIATYMNKELPFNSGQGLVAYYKLNGLGNGSNASVNQVIDEVSNTANATLYTNGIINWVTGNVSGTAQQFAGPAVSVSTTAPTVFCQGGSVTLTANATNVTTPTYQWYKDNVAITTGGTANTYTANTTGSYTVTVTSNICTATSIATTVTVKPIPTVTVSSNSPYNSGSNINLYASGATTYSWTGPDSYTSSIQNPVIEFASVAKAGTYTVTGTTNGCSLSQSTLINVNLPRGLDFDGVNDYVDIDDYSVGNFYSSVDFTMSIHVKPTQGGSVNFMIKRPSGTCSYGNFWTLGTNATNKVVFEIDGGSSSNYHNITSANALNIGSWNDIAVKRSGSNLYLIVNGVSSPAVPVTTFSINNTSKIRISGSNCDPTGYNFKGIIDEIRIWDSRAVCDFEINNNRNKELDLDRFRSSIGTHASLSNYYSLNQGVSQSPNPNETTMLDNVGGKNGTLHNFNLTGLSSNWINSEIITVAPSLIEITSQPLGQTVFEGRQATPLSVTADFPAAGLIEYWWGKKINNLNYQNVAGPNSATYTPPTNTAGSTIYNVELDLKCVTTARPTLLVAQKTSNDAEVIVKPHEQARSINFDGQNDYAKTPNSMTNLGNKSFSIDFMAKMDLTKTGTQIVFEHGGTTTQGLSIGFRITNATTGSFFASFSGLTELQANITPDTVWHHWTATFNATTNKREIYRDGTLLTSDVISRPNWAVPANSTYYIGQAPYGYPFKGNLRELRIWKKALSANDISSVKSKTLPFVFYNCPAFGLLSYFRMDDAGRWMEDVNNSTVLKDIVNPTNNATLTNMMLTGMTSNWSSGQVLDTAQGNVIVPSSTETLPVPQERQDFVNYPFSTTGSDTRWEWNVNGTGWVSAPRVSSLDSAAYAIPYLQPSTSNTQFRRILCNTFTTADTSIAIPFTTWSIGTNGSISGKVTGGTSGMPIKGVEITIVRKTANLSGSPDYLVYKDTTDDFGRYSIEPIYYGNPASNLSKATFMVTPTRGNHKFNPDSIPIELTGIRPQVVQNFSDMTAVTVSGKITQHCRMCDDTTVVLPVDSVHIYKNTDTAVVARTGIIDNEHGRYSVSLDNPGPVRIRPDSFHHHTFSPADSTLNVLNSVADVNFEDITTHFIRGHFSGSCPGQDLGRAVLEFREIQPSGPSRFIKTDTVAAGSGIFVVELPARKYTVVVKEVLDATTTDEATSAVIVDFFHRLRAPDVFDITERDTNDVALEYVMKPYIQVTGGPGAKICTNDTFKVLSQGDSTVFRVKILAGQGGCPIKGTSKLFEAYSDIGDISNSVYFTPRDTGVLVKVYAGRPNITPPYEKYIQFKYIDTFNRPEVTFNDTVKVLGAKEDATTFTTIAPQRPFMVLHDPPGDRSYAFWEKGTTFHTTHSWYNGEGNGDSYDVYGHLGFKDKKSIFGAASWEAEFWAGVRQDFSRVAQPRNDSVVETTDVLTTRIETSSDNTLVGADADVYVGAAQNILYAMATYVRLDPADAQGCTVNTKRDIVVGSDAFQTQFQYTGYYIKNVLIAELQANAAIWESRDSLAYPQRKDSMDFYNGEAKAWLKILEDNKKNREEAVFDPGKYGTTNLSFSGAVKRDGSVTGGITRTGTYSWDVEVNAGVAAEMHWDVNGSGIDAQYKHTFVLVEGHSEGDAVDVTTTTGYHLEDGDIGDAFSVDIKRDQRYGSPVFVTRGGQSSCPTEDNTRPRDEGYMTLPFRTRNQVNPTTTANFVFKLRNTSQSGETRPYWLAFDETSNPYGASIDIGSGGSNSKLYNIRYLDSVQAIVKVGFLNDTLISKAFSYEGLRFNLLTDCGDTLDTKTVDANFVSPCSNITLADPGDNWVVNGSGGAANRNLKIRVTNYDDTKLKSVNIQYSKDGKNDWRDLGIRWDNNHPLEVNPLAGTEAYANLSTLDDSIYNIRAELTCGHENFIVYSNRVTGTLDTHAPSLIGTPEPADRNFVPGDKIIYSYNDLINTVNLNSKVKLYDSTDRVIVPARVGGYNNTVTIEPDVNMRDYTGHKFMVVVKNIADKNGNINTSSDTIYFVAGASAANTNATIANVSTGTGTTNGTSTTNTGTPPAISEKIVTRSGRDTIKVTFTLNDTAWYTRSINFSLGGTAVYGRDYKTAFGFAKKDSALYSSFNGSSGTIVVNGNSNQSVLYIIPFADSVWRPNDTVLIALSDGGSSYGIGNQYLVRGIIQSRGTISYAGSPFCQSVSTAQPVTKTGTTVGTFSSATGLKIDPITGAITPSLSIPGTYSITYRVAASGSVPAYRTDTTVTITAPPSASISYTGSPFSKLITTAQGVTQTGMAGGWFSSTNGLVLDSLTGAITPSASVPGTYTVTYTIPAVLGCSQYSTTTDVTIVSVPCSGIASISADKNPVCSGSTTTLTANGVTGPNAIVTWYTGAMGTGTNLGAGYTFSNAGIGTFYARVTSDCGDPVEKSITITAATAPAAPVITTVPAVTTGLCPGSPITLTATAASSYLWSSGETTQSITVTAGGSYTVTVYNDAGCGKTSVAKAITYACTAPASPASIGITDKGATLKWKKVACAGGYELVYRVYGVVDSTTVLLTDTSYLLSGLSPATKYSWKVRSACGSQVSSFSATITFTTLTPSKPNLGADTTVFVCPGLTRSIRTVYNTTSYTTAVWNPSSVDSAAKGVYTLIVTNSAGKKDTAVVTVAERPLMNPVIDPAGPFTMCTGDSITLSVFNGPYTSYKWSNGPVTASNLVKTFGNFIVTVKDVYGCSKASNPVTVNNTTPTPVITTNPASSLNLCPNTVITLTAPASGSYLWSSGETTQSISKTVAGSYTVMVANGNCSAASAVTRVTYLSCGSPLSPTAGYISGSTALLSWRWNACANYYEVQYRKVGTTTFTTIQTPDTAYVVMGLINNTSYEWRLRTVCTTTPLSVSGYTALATFTTNQSVTAKPDLGADTTVYTCPAVPRAITGLYNTTPYLIAKYNAANPAAVAAGVYSLMVMDYYGKRDTAQITVQERPTMNPVVSPSGAVALCAGDSLVLTLLNGPFASQTWTNGATTSSILVKTAGSYNVTATDVYGCSKTATAADVTIASLPAVPTITSNPSNTLNLCPNTVVTYTSSPATRYLWSTGDSAQTMTKTVAGSYTVKVFNSSNCTATSAIKRVTYLSCGTPLTPTVLGVSGSSATVSWRRVNCAVSYEVQYRRTGTTTFTTVSATDTSVTLNNLVAQVSYDWRVRAICTTAPLTASGYTAVSTFMTGSGNKGMYVRAPLPVSVENEPLRAIVYPNPANKAATLQLSGTVGEYILTLSAPDGKVLWQTNKLSKSTVELPVANKPPGVYLITLNIGNEKKILKLVIER